VLVDAWICLLRRGFSATVVVNALRPTCASGFPRLVSPYAMLYIGTITRIDGGRGMSDDEISPATLLDELASLDAAARRELVTTLRTLSETFAEVPDGKAASHVLGVLAHLLDPS
jgi:hypothetical protein